MERLVDRLSIYQMLRAKAYRYISEREIDAEVDKRTKIPIYKEMDPVKAKIALEMFKIADGGERLEFGEATANVQVQGDSLHPIQFKIIREEAPQRQEAPQIERPIINLTPRIEEDGKFIIEG